MKAYWAATLGGCVLLSVLAMLGVPEWVHLLGGIGVGIAWGLCWTRMRRRLR